MVRFEHHARNVSLLTLLSRVTGLGRDAALSRVFGAGALTDAFFFAFMIPNLFRRLFGEGALSAAFLPVYTRLDRDDPETAARLASALVAALLVGLGVIVVVCEGVLWWLVARAEPGDGTPLRLMMIMLPYMPLVCLVAILGAMLQVHDRFGPTAAAPVILNLCLIGTTLGLLAVFPAGDADARRAHIMVVASSVVVAGLMQLAWSVAALRSRGWWRRGTLRAGAAGAPTRSAMGEVGRQAGPMIVGLGVLQLNTLLDGIIASYPTAVGDTIFGVSYPLETGSMAAVSFAQRLYQFPLGVFGIAVATAIFPALARTAETPDDFVATLRRGLRLVVFIGLPASAGLVLVRDSLAAVVLQGGDFGPEDVRRVGFVLLGYAPAVWAYSLVHVLTRAFYARGEARTPVRVAIGVVALNLTLNLTLIWTPLREAGLAWSTAICAVVQAGLLLVLLRRRTARLVDSAVSSSWFRTAIGTAVMSIAVAGVAMLLPSSETWLASLGRLAALVVTGALVMVAASAALGQEEMRWLLRR